MKKKWRSWSRGAAPANAQLWKVSREVCTFTAGAEGHCVDRSSSPVRAHRQWVRHSLCATASHLAPGYVDAASVQLWDAHSEVCTRCAARTVFALPLRHLQGRTHCDQGGLSERHRWERPLRQPMSTSRTQGGVVGLARVRTQTHDPFWPRLPQASVWYGCCPFKLRHCVLTCAQCHWMRAGCGGSAPRVCTGHRVAPERVHVASVEHARLHTQRGAKSPSHPSAIWGVVEGVWATGCKTRSSRRPPPFLPTPVLQ